MLEHMFEWVAREVQAIGTNRRYARHFDAKMDESIVKSIAARNPLQSLTDEELDLGALPLTRDPQPKEALVWVRFGPHPIRRRAQVVAWTPRAIAVRFRIGDKEHKAWVWASAVSEPPPGGATVP